MILSDNLQDSVRRKRRMNRLTPGTKQIRPVDIRARKASAVALPVVPRRDRGVVLETAVRPPRLAPARCGADGARPRLLVVDAEAVGADGDANQWNTCFKSLTRDLVI